MKRDMKEYSMLQHKLIRQKTVAFALLFFSVASFYSKSSGATTPQSTGIQLAYFLGTNSVGMRNNSDFLEDSVDQGNYYVPKYHFRGSYHGSWTHARQGCRQSCILDRWTGKSISCTSNC